MTLFRTLPALTAAFLLAACNAGNDKAPPAAVEFTQDTACTLDGMLLSEFPGPKGQIRYEGTPPEFFCDTVEVLAALLRPEQQRRLLAAYVQDMGAAAWDKPRGHWIDAHAAFYVKDSKRRGAMGPTLISFAQEAAAKAFAAQEGGVVLRFAEITPAMVNLDGGALHDKGM